MNAVSEKPHLAIIPAFNESASIGAVVAGLVGQGLDVLVVDDCSRDATAARAREAGAVVVGHVVNLGYGAALQTGYLYALKNGHQTVVQLDGDGQHDPGFAPALLAEIESGRADLVIGSRFLEAGGYPVPLTRRIGQRLFGGILKLATGLRITDPTSGFQALSNKVLRLYSRPPFPDDFPDADILLMASRAGCRIREIPVRMFAPPDGKSMHRGLGRQIYYVLKMTLALFIAAIRNPPREVEGP